MRPGLSLCRDKGPVPRAPSKPSLCSSRVSSARASQTPSLFYLLVFSQRLGCMNTEMCAHDVHEQMSDERSPLVHRHVPN